MAFGAAIGPGVNSQMIQGSIRPTYRPQTTAAAQMASQGGIRQIRSKPGLLYDPNQKKFFKIVDTTQHAQYDTEMFVGAAGTGSVGFGSLLKFAQNITNKDLIDTNFTQQRRLTAGQVMWVSRVGLYFPSKFGDQTIDYLDQQAIGEGAYFLLKINNKELLRGPAVFFPAGFGWYGSTSKNNAGVVSMGLPSLGGVLPLAKKIYLNEHYDVDATLTLQQHAWAPTAALATANVAPVIRNGTNAGVPNSFVPVKFILHGRLYSPSTV